MNYYNIRKINPDLEKYSNIFIFGTTSEAKYSFFATLLEKGCYIKGFVDEQFSNRNISLYNKKIYSVDEVMALDNCAIIVPKIDFELFINSRLRNIPCFINGIFLSELEGKKKNSFFVFDEKLKDKEIVVYGTGFYGDQIARDFFENGYSISFFCDSNRKKQGTIFHNRPVFPKDEIYKHPDAIIIIAASAILDITRELNVESVYIDVFKLFIEYNKIPLNGKVFLGNEYALDLLLSQTKGKQLYVLGQDDAVDLIQNILVKCEKSEATRVCDIYEYVSEMVCNSILIDVSDTIYENQKLVIEFGIEVPKQYISVDDGFSSTMYYSHSGIVDGMIGNTYVYGGKVGTRIFSNSKEPCIRILTLGGSTTDAVGYQTKSWSEFLYEKCKDNGIDAEVICCGVAGWTSINELVKLLRDGLSFHPDIVVSYSGYNDVRNVAIQNQIMNCGQEIMNSILHERYHKVYWGELKSHDIDLWLQNEAMMHAICKEFGIRFMGFWQPCSLTTQIDWANDSHVMHFLRGNAVDIARIEKSQNLICKSQQYSAIIRKRNLQYIFDISNLFDNYDLYDIFEDWIHLREEGNRIVGDTIYEYIFASTQ